jgi:para-nitrobenzyl esterase
VGPRRWAPPAPGACWTGERDASTDGPASLQADASGSAASRLLTLTYPAQSEDCLTVTVWRPLTDAGDGRPVMVFLHGGAFVTGSGSQAIYDGAALSARGGVVVVNVNYRLGIMGWLRDAELGATGNEGLADQLAALDWVQQEVAAFGGDPDLVTVFGESAGAISIAAMLAAGRTPFRRAILQSGAANLIGPVERAEATAAKLRAAGELSRAVAAAELNALQDRVTPRAAGIAYRPVADGELVPRDPLAAIAAGSARHVELLVGANVDEFGFFIGLDPRFDELDADGLRRLVAPRAGQGTDDVIAAYTNARKARGDDVNPRSLAIAILGDDEFRVPGLRLAEAHAAAGGRSHTYLFGWRSPIFGGAVGAGHVLEMPFVLGNHRHPHAAAYVGDAPGADELAAEMMDAWAAFAHTGDPGWPTYGPPDRLTRRFRPGGGVEAEPLGAERRAWGDRSTARPCLARGGVHVPAAGRPPPVDRAEVRSCPPSAPRFRRGGSGPVRKLPRNGPVDPVLRPPECPTHRGGDERPAAPRRPDAGGRVGRS